MRFPCGRAMNLATGRYWWVLVVGGMSSDESSSAHILRVVRGRSAGRSVVDISFSVGMPVRFFTSSRMRMPSA